MTHFIKNKQFVIKKYNQKFDQERIDFKRKHGKF